MIHKNVAVNVLTWNDWKNTTECIKSVMKSSFKNYDMVVVDNNSEEFHYKKLFVFPIDFSMSTGENLLSHCF